VSTADPALRAADVGIGANEWLVEQTSDALAEAPGVARQSA
jgi:hypothetical protein